MAASLTLEAGESPRRSLAASEGWHWRARGWGWRVISIEPSTLFPVDGGTSFRTVSSARFDGWRRRRVWWLWEEEEAVE